MQPGLGGFVDDQFAADIADACSHNGAHQERCHEAKGVPLPGGLTGFENQQVFRDGNGIHIPLFTLLSGAGWCHGYLESVTPRWLMGDARMPNTGDRPNDVFFSTLSVGPVTPSDEGDHRSAAMNTVHAIDWCAGFAGKEAQGKGTCSDELSFHAIATVSLPKAEQP
jgi:hypothetical protein